MTRDEKEVMAQTRRHPSPMAELTPLCRSVFAGLYLFVTACADAQTANDFFQPVVHIETVDLASRGIVLPNDRVGMVVAQPHLSLTPNEPYRCEPAAKDGQLAALDATFVVARAAAHGAAKTHFTLFPEYSIPGLDGVARVDAAVGAANWPAGTIVIGGTDGLSRTDFSALAGQPHTHVCAGANDLTRITANEWVNCGITWVKAANGTVERWLQPKLHPAWPEQAVQYQAMFNGRSIFTFRGTLENGSPYRFSTLVCFDWIASVENQKAWRWVVDDVRRQAEQAQAELPLSWLFVIQCNRQPSHDSFLNEVSAFFNQTDIPTVRRERACLVFANVAGRSSPGRTDLYGGTSLVFTGQTLFTQAPCPVTFSNGGSRFRSSTLLNAYRDVYFRERGACIHSFAQVNPNSLHAGAADRTMAVERAFVYPLNGAFDPRAPSAPVPGCVKWLNDDLDALPGLHTHYPLAALAGPAGATHQRSISALRGISAQSATHTVGLAACQLQAKHADEWDRVESEAVEHLVNTLDIVAIAYPDPQVGTDPAHATVIVGGQAIDLLAIRGQTHEACIEHSKKFSPLPHRPVLLISRDRDNTSWYRKFGSILETEPGHLGPERRFTDPRGGSLHLGYARLLDIFRQSPTPAAVQEAIHAELAA